MKKLICIFISTFLTACSSVDYKLYSSSLTEIELNKTKIEIAKYNADAEKYKAIATIAVSGTETSKVAAVMAMAMGNNNSITPSQQNQNILRAPESTGDAMLKWGGLLIPSLTQFYSIKSNTSLGMRNSDNVSATAQSTNNAFVSMAGKIQMPQQPVVVIPQPNVVTTTTNTNTLSGTGTLGSGAFANTDSHNTLTTNTDSHNTLTTPVSQSVPVSVTP